MTDECAQCGFVYDLSRAATAGDAITERVGTVVTILRRRDVDLRSRRQPAQWSPLEYGCHLRDMLLVQRERVLAALRVDRPDCTAMGRDERAVHDGYADQEPVDVARQLADAAQMLGNVLGRLSDGDWNRTVRYHFPETSERSLRWLAVHTAHEAQHHLGDISSQL
ncbi:DinB family protein [Mycobacterium sp. Aquia_216]|uniref:DinB family protein n=1 Tax=Mycobacterium sp. Aquia_216 TaxID=2991729 RepID=UPI00227CC8BC|nr:DinB family protein [Mycobacterium sp. Aquia_216]WAJ46031.1 DinB family protein [Mycobacterium sp. Aquia_216]